MLHDDEFLPFAHLLSEAHAHRSRSERRLRSKGALPQHTKATPTISARKRKRKAQRAARRVARR